MGGKILLAQAEIFWKANSCSIKTGLRRLGGFSSSAEGREESEHNEETKETLIAGVVPMLRLVLEQSPEGFASVVSQGFHHHVSGYKTDVSKSKNRFMLGPPGDALPATDTVVFLINTVST